MVLYLNNTGWMKRNLHTLVIISLFGLLRIATGQQTDGTTESLNPSLSPTTFIEEPKLLDMLTSSDARVVSSTDSKNDYLNTQSEYYADTIATSSLEIGIIGTSNLESSIQSISTDISLSNLESSIQSISTDISVSNLESSSQPNTFNMESSIHSVSTDISASNLVSNIQYISTDINTSNLESSSQSNTFSVESSIQSSLESTIQYFTTKFITTSNLESSIQATSTDFITTSSLDSSVQPIITDTITTANFDSSIQSIGTYNLTPSSLESSILVISTVISTTISLESTMQQTKIDSITASSLESNIQPTSIIATSTLESNIHIPLDSSVTSSIEPSEITTSYTPYNTYSTSTIGQLIIDSTVYQTQLTSSLFYSPSTITSDTDLWSSLTTLHTLESINVSYSLDTLQADSIFSLDPTSSISSPLIYDSFSAQITQELSSSGTEILSSTSADILLTEAHSDVSSTVESMASLFQTSSFLDVTSIAMSTALTDVSFMPDSSVDLETTIRITLSDILTASMTPLLESSYIETYAIENGTIDSVMSQSITLLTDTSTLINSVPMSSVLVTDNTVSPEVTWSESFVSTMAEYSLTTSMVSVLSVETVLTSLQPHGSELSLSYIDTASSIISWSTSKEIPLESSHILETSYISDSISSNISDMTSLYLSDMTSAYLSDIASSYTSDITSAYISDVTTSNISDMTSSNISDMTSMTSHTFNDLSSLVSLPFPEGTIPVTEYITFHISSDISSMTMSDITISASLTSDYFSSMNTSSVSLYPTVQDSSYYTSSEVSTSKSLFPELLTSSFNIQSIWPSSVNWTDTSSGVMSSSLSDITLTFSNSLSETLNSSISTGGFIEPTLTYTASVSTTEVVIQNSSSLLIVSSVVPEFTLSPTPLSSFLPSSSLIPTVPPTTGPTVPNIENSKNKTEFWVVTKFKVRPSVDIQAVEFKNGLEKGLANAYALSKIRNEEKINGTYVPLKKRKRASVADKDNTVQVEIVSLTRPDTLTVDATYVVQENGQIVPAQQVSDQLNLLSSQEMAIQTGQVVTQTAQPYITPASSEDNTKWIILGSVLGGVLVLAILIFILCCCCGRCCQAKGKDNQVAMEAVKTYVSDEPEARRKSFAFASKKGKYSVSTEKEEDDPLYASIKPSMKANKKKDVTQPTENNQEEIDMEEKPVKKLRQDTPQKKRRKKALDTNEELRSVYESQMASLQTKTFSNEEYTLTSQPTVEEEGDLLENAEEERKKNKQRLREKKKSEQGALSHPVNLTTNVYESAQREIDKVLGPRLSHDSEDGQEKKQEKKRKKKEKKGKENEGFVPDEPKGETLEEARERMHKLLDDAFSLISHSKSSISNKVQPVDSSDAYSSSTSKHNTPRQDHAVQADLDSSASEEKKHTPINVQRTHEPYDSSGLITWSPYRASDEIVTISLPSTQTNLSSQPPQQEKLTTSTFVETAPPRKNSYLATEPGKPIVIKTKNFEDSLPPSGSQKHKGFNGNAAQHSSDIRTRQETFQNPAYENTLPLRTTETYTEPYHGLASYQDLPVSHLAGKVSNGKPPVRQSAWQEERSKLADMAPLSLNASPRDVIDVRSHTGPQHGEKKHFDEVDVITESLRPGASPQPLINSLRDELQSLSSKRQTGPNKHPNQPGNGETKRLKDYLPSQLNTSQAESESSWGSMHRNTSKV